MRTALLLAPFLILLATPAPHAETLSNGVRSAGAATDVSAARRRGYRYCASQKITGAEVCSFASMRQCQADIRGKGGFCYRRPY